MLSRPGDLQFSVSMWSFYITLKSEVLSLSVAGEPGYGMEIEQTKKASNKAPCQQRGEGTDQYTVADFKNTH